MTWFAAVFRTSSGWCLSLPGASELSVTQAEALSLAPGCVVCVGSEHLVRVGQYFISPDYIGTKANTGRWAQPGCPPGGSGSPGRGQTQLRRHHQAPRIYPALVLPLISGEPATAELRSVPVADWRLRVQGGKGTQGGLCAGVYVSQSWWCLSYQ